MTAVNNVAVTCEIWGFRPSVILKRSLLGNGHSMSSVLDKATSCGKVSRMSVYGRHRKWFGKNNLRRL